MVSLFELQENDATQAAEELRSLLSEWLTVPVVFDEQMEKTLEFLGDIEAARLRWGSVVARALHEARCSAKALATSDNPLQVEVRKCIRELYAKNCLVKVYAYRSSQKYFDPMLAEPQSEGTKQIEYIHSIAEYRKSDVFDVLVKVGPLRSRGWGAAPDALLSAPRFRVLRQFVWNGCEDEPNFGYDATDTVTRLQTGGIGVEPRIQTRWSRTIQRSELGATGSSGTEMGVLSGQWDADDLAVMQNAHRTDETRPAVLVQLGNDLGILYPPSASVLTFAPHTDDSIHLRRPGEDLEPGMYLVRPLLDDAELGQVRAGEGRYSIIWKEKLRSELKRSPYDLVKKLQNAGVRLIGLRSAVEHWCKPSTTVIHAPQQRRNFELLLQVLGIDAAVRMTNGNMVPWWQMAWREIAHTRGEAIQTGMQENELVQAELVTALNKLIPEIRARTNGGASEFSIDLPAGHYLNGFVSFYRVHSIDEGFNAPGETLKEITSLKATDKWRS